MPITVDAEIRVLTQDEFHALHHRVLGVVFEVHNEFGPLFDESLYKRAIAQRCSARGIIPTRREVNIRLTHDGFVKDFFLDLLLADGLMVEAKTVESLSPAHRAQTLNYLLLTGMRHGSLINLRPSRVKHEFISTTLTPAERRQFMLHDTEWQDVNEQSRLVRRTMIEVLTDWGVFLQVSLYREALIHCLGGEGLAVRKTDIFDGENPVGTHEVCLLGEDTILALTAITKSRDVMRDHLQRFLDHTKRTHVQWINLNHHKIEFVTLTRKRRLAE
jgi:GxxExxY protein